MANIRRLTKEDMEKVVGGFTCEGPWEWIKGMEIKCLYCGEESNDTVRYIAATSKINAVFFCEKCKRTFKYYNYPNGIYLCDDSGKGKKIKQFS